jgi:hypothetical protein
MRENPEEDVTISGELEIKIKYSTEVNRDLSLSEKLQIMEEVEKELVEKIKLLDNVKKIEI